MSDRFLVVIDGEDLVFCKTLSEALEVCAAEHKDRRVSEIFETVGELDFTVTVKKKKVMRGKKS